MKRREDFILRQVAGTWVVLPVGKAAERFNGMLTLNDSGVMLWNVLETNPDPRALVEALMGEYEVTEEQARADVEAFLEVLTRAGCLEE